MSRVKRQQVLRRVRLGGRYVVVHRARRRVSAASSAPASAPPLCRMAPRCCFSLRQCVLLAVLALCTSAADHYRTLGLSRGASASQVRKAYRALAKRHHPDTATGDEVAFRAVATAYEVLSDPAARRDYDDAFSTGNARWDGAAPRFASPHAGARRARPVFQTFRGADGRLYQRVVWVDDGPPAEASWLRTLVSEPLIAVAFIAVALAIAQFRLGGNRGAPVHNPSGGAARTTPRVAPRPGPSASARAPSSAPAAPFAVAATPPPPPPPPAHVPAATPDAARPRRWPELTPALLRGHRKGVLLVLTTDAVGAGARNRSASGAGSRGGDSGGSGPGARLHAALVAAEAAVAATGSRAAVTLAWTTASTLPAPAADPSSAPAEVVGAAGDAGDAKCGTAGGGDSGVGTTAVDCGRGDGADDGRGTHGGGVSDCSAAVDTTRAPQSVADAEEALPPTSPAPSSVGAPSTAEAAPWAAAWARVLGDDAAEGTRLVCGAVTATALRVKQLPAEEHGSAPVSVRACSFVVAGVGSGGSSGGGDDVGVDAAPARTVAAEAEAETVRRRLAEWLALVTEGGVDFRDVTAHVAGQLSLP